MPKQPKGKNANARVSEDLYLKIQEYAEFSDASVGHIIRQALQEYIWAHPLKTEEVVKRRAEKELKLRTILTKQEA